MAKKDSTDAYALIAAIAAANGHSAPAEYADKVIAIFNGEEPKETTETNQE